MAATSEISVASAVKSPIGVNGTEQFLPSPDMLADSAGAAAGDAGGVLIVNREGALTPDEHYINSQHPSQMAVHVRSSTSTPAAAAVAAAQAASGNGSMSQEDMRMRAGERLQMLQAGMVGGELADNKEIQERRKGRLKHAEERKNKLAEANLELEDEGIMVGIYESIQDQLRAKNKQLTREKQKVTSMEQEILDIQSEFEQDRIDYLDAIRKQERQLLLLQAIVDRVQPCIRRDCNYSNIDRIKKEAKFDEEANDWHMPTLTLERTQLPLGAPPGGAITSAPVNNSFAGSIGGGRRSPMTTGGGDEEDRYYQKLAQKADPSKEFFTSRRAQELLAVNTRAAAAAASNSPISMMGDQRAAAVHGQWGPPGGGGSAGAGGPPSLDSSAEETGFMRRPSRLEALPMPQTAGKRGRKKRFE